MTSLKGKKLLIAPLDWGLGHATRCIPLIKALKENDCEIWIACEGQQETLLKQEFPDLSFLFLPGYRVKITGKNTIISLFKQIPTILKSIKYEKKWLDEHVKKFDFDAVISDNRFGLYHKKAHSIFITHQLCIKSSLGKWCDTILQKINYTYINHFNECWVPDEKGNENIAGELSHPKKLPKIPVSYIGILSRFELKQIASVKDHLLIILSGPEPQRSRFETMIINQITGYNGTAVIVRGLPAAKDIIPSTNKIIFHNHLPATSLNDEMLKASYIISRSGYSTIMDLVRLKKKSILVPTPGQAEQEYLARHMHFNKYAYSVSQKNFSLNESLRAAAGFNYSLPYNK